MQKLYLHGHFKYPNVTDYLLLSKTKLNLFKIGSDVDYEYTNPP